MPADTFVCAMCKGTFDKEWPEEEALAESETIFGKVPLSDLVMVCDDCWELVRPR